MLSIRAIRAIFMKQIKDTLKNKTVLIQFILFPLMAFILTESVAKSDESIPVTYFVILFATMYVGMVPTLNIANIIAEEKDSNTLRVLMFANVRPMEYLLGVGSYVFFICSIGVVAFGLIAGYTGIILLKFIGILLLGLMVSIVLGGMIGAITKNQMSSTAIVTPIAMFAAFIPMITMFNKNFEVVSRFLYTEQVNRLINQLEASNMSIDSLIIIAINLIIFLVLFAIAYRKRGLVE